MTLRVYRIEVLAWPTEDGRPWERFYGYGSYYFGDGDGYDEPEPPAWVLACADDPEVADRFRYDDSGQLIGVVMPKVTRRHYLSASGARTLARHMEAFGARVLVHASDPVGFAVDR